MNGVLERIGNTIQKMLMHEFVDSKSPEVLPELSPWQHVDQAANKIMATWSLTRTIWEAYRNPSPSWLS